MELDDDIVEAGLLVQEGQDTPSTITTPTELLSLSTIDEQVSKSQFFYSII